MEIKLKNLVKTSKNWDGKTKQMLLHFQGYGNIEGGISHGYHITIHGTDSNKTGIEIHGVFIESYDIQRGTSIKGSGSTKYFPCKSFEEVENTESEYEISVKGSCHTGVETLAQILMCHVDYYEEIVEDIKELV